MGRYTKKTSGKTSIKYWELYPQVVQLHEDLILVFVLFECLLLSLSYLYLLFFLLWTWIVCLIKTVKNWTLFWILYLQDCFIIICSNNKNPFRFYNNKNKLSLPSWETQKILNLHQIWVNSKRNLWRETNAWGLDPLPSHSPLHLKRDTAPLTPFDFLNPNPPHGLATEFTA